ncbi:MAG: Electron transport complex subunit RnfC [Calditrichaeota bacterium]|nr:Electron transport complex subunit RnfC [Calditrichota bacterium]
MKKTFRGGTHPPEFKLTAGIGSRALPAPEMAYVPIQQHIGAPGKPLVRKKDEVTVGQPLTEPGGFVSVPAHAPVSGKVKDVGPYPNPVGREMLTVIIEADDDGGDAKGEEDADWADASAEEIRARVRDAGIAGMGGAAFPTHVKLSPPENKPVDTVIINGAECEPYLTSDHRLMLERSDDIIRGALLVRRAVGANRLLVAVEDNKPDAHSALKKAAKSIDPGIQVEMLPVKYPQGAEKQLINALTGREVPPPPALPMDVGCLVQNVGSCVAICEAVRWRKPLIERYVTVTGSGINEPANVIAKIGTPLAELVEAAGGYTDDAAKLILGGPMMGMAQWTDAVPVIKGTSGVLVLNRADAAVAAEQPCIGCGRCVNVCPVFLLPTNIARLSELEMWKDAEAMGVLECIECGSCTYVCPSHRILVQHIRFGKATVIAEKRKAKQKAEKAA